MIETVNFFEILFSIKLFLERSKSNFGILADFNNN